MKAFMYMGYIKFDVIKDKSRYMSQFSAMESAVTGFKKTGEFLTGFIESLNPKD